MNIKLFTSLLFVVAISNWSLAYAHHSFAAYFIVDEFMTIEGVVTKFERVNPHSRIYMDVTNENDEIEHWIVEGSSLNVYTRTGITQETIKPGMVLTIIGNPTRDGSKMVGLGKQAKLLIKGGRQIWPPLQ